MKNRKEFKDENLSEINKKEDKMVKKNIGRLFDDLLINFIVVIAIVMSALGSILLISTLSIYGNDILISDSVLRLILSTILIGLGFVILKNFLED